jgi:hypothetical protein
MTVNFGIGGILSVTLVNYFDRLGCIFVDHEFGVLKLWWPQCPFTKYFPAKLREAWEKSSFLSMTKLQDLGQ